VVTSPYLGAVDFRLAMYLNHVKIDEQDPVEYANPKGHGFAVIGVPCVSGEYQGWQKISVREPDPGYQRMTPVEMEEAWSKPAPIQCPAPTASAT